MLAYRLSVLAFVTALSTSAQAQSVTIDASAAGRQQTIDGFGTCLSGTEGQETWFQDLYFGDMQCSMLRLDLTPKFKPPYSDNQYNSPGWNQAGPDGTFVRSYTTASDYKRTWNGNAAQIAVMGPDIEKNVDYFDYADDMPKTAGELAKVGDAKKVELGDFKLFASVWSPAPWVKLSSGNKYNGPATTGYPAAGAPWPFLWLGNFAGGVLDVSDTPLADFDDGTGPTSALTQFARGLAAYVHGLQTTYGVRLYALSIQNELGFEEFYNSCRYAQAPAYIKALKAARAELDKHDDLKGILIEGPEDLLGGDGWGFWQYGGGTTATHKNLQLIQAVAADPAAASALGFFSIHGYAPDGVNAAGSDPVTWTWWNSGWTTAPAAGLPATVKGFTGYQKKSWMTETSGESADWLAPATGFPKDGAFSIALKIHQALTAGRQSAWAYWQFSDGSDVGASTLTDATQKAASPKYVAAKHFFRYVRPGAVAVKTSVTGSTTLGASAYVNDAAGTLTAVLVNGDAADVTASIAVGDTPSGLTSFEAYTSKKDSYWQKSNVVIANRQASVQVPGYGVVTLYGSGAATVLPEAGADANAQSGAEAGQEGSPSGTGGCGCRASSGGSHLGVGLVLLFSLLLRRRAGGLGATGTPAGTSVRTRPRSGAKRSPVAWRVCAWRGAPRAG
jgi:O-glycosyl hydrolase